MQQMSLAQTEYISNTGGYFESTGSAACGTTATKGQSTEINTRLLESETLDPDKLKFNLVKSDAKARDESGKVLKNKDRKIHVILKIQIVTNVFD